MPFRAGGAGARPPCRWLCRHPPRYGRDTHALPCVPLSPEGFRHPGAWALGLGRPLQRPLWSPSQVSSLQEKGLDPCPTCHPACRSLEAQCVLPPPGQVGFLSFRTSDHPPPSRVLHPEPVSSLRGLLGGEVALLARGPQGHQGVTPRLPAWCPPAPSCQNVGLRGAAQSQSCPSSLIPSVRLRV